MMRSLIILLFTLFTSLSASAVSVSYLWGNNFREDLGYEKEKFLMTIENFSVWEYGTVFFYYDITEPFSDNRGDSSQFFGGISPTFSTNKMFGWNYTGFVRDVSIRLELENGSGYGANNFRNYFYGLQYDLAMPWFDFFSLNTVLRDNPNSRSVGYQIGMFWQKTWDFGRWNKYKFTGFLATSPTDGDIDPEKEKGFYKASNRGRYLTTQPQFLWDLGYGWTGKPNRIELGFEYAYFLNRYQLNEKDEKVLQVMTKISF